jgi:iron-sulfur cluster repair protein YtfE (RIC family)
LIGGLRLQRGRRRARTLRAMDIFDALIRSHELQRAIARRLLSDIGEGKERSRDFEQLKTELSAHETAEERAFYIPLMEHDEAVEAARHGIAEHHEMDEMVERIDKLEPGSAEWLEQLGALVHKLEHHLKEEEDRWFPLARRILPRAEQQQLGEPYQEEHDRLKAKEEQS